MNGSLEFKCLDHNGLSGIIYSVTIDDLLLCAGASSCTACDAGKYSNSTGQLPLRVHVCCDSLE